MKEKDGRLLDEVGLGSGFPGGDGEGLDLHIRKGEGGGDAEKGRGVKLTQTRLEGVGVAIGGFDEDVGHAGSVLPGAEGEGALPRLFGDVSMEGERLATETRKHEGVGDRGAA